MVREDMASALRCMTTDLDELATEDADLADQQAKIDQRRTEIKEATQAVRVTYERYAAKMATEAAAKAPEPVQAVLVTPVANDTSVARRVRSGMRRGRKRGRNGETQSDHLRSYASSNGGTIHLSEAADYFMANKLAGGTMQNLKKGLSKLLASSDQFERIGQGLYRLKE